MTVKSQVYDHPTYVTRQSSVHTSLAGSGAIGCRFTAFTNMLAYSATVTVQTAGTSAANNLVILEQVSGTATTTFGTLTLGTASANTVFTTTLTNVAGGVTMLQGDVLRAVNGTDIVGVFSLAWEVSVQPEANVTA
jgi:hypothetical protein